MENLAGQIERDIEARGLCAVYVSELDRVWPKNLPNRRRKIEEFAKEHGWLLGHYNDAFVVIFDKEWPRQA
jgi:hypothetical protein